MIAGRLNGEGSPRLLPSIIINIDKVVWRFFPDTAAVSLRAIIRFASAADRHQQKGHNRQTPTLSAAQLLDKHIKY